VDLRARAAGSATAALSLVQGEEGTHLVDEEDAGHDLGLALLAPVADLGVDLVAQL